MVLLYAWSCNSLVITPIENTTIENERFIDAVVKFSPMPIAF
jgi:hypothetical protein